MFLQFADWLIYADKESTHAYCQEELLIHCNCAYCRNYYQNVDKANPDLRYFLSRFGVDIETPDSLIPVTPQLYQASYLVHGKILRYGSEPIWVKELPVTLEQDEDPDSFYLHLGLIELPWTLSEGTEVTPKPFSLADMLAINEHKKAPQQP